MSQVVKLWEAPSISVQLFVWFMCECQQINRLPPIHTSQTKPFYRIQTMKHMKWRQHELQSWQIWLHFTLRILLQRLHSRTQESLKAGHTEFIQCPHSCLSVHSRRNSTPSFDVEQWNGQKREVVEPQVPRCSCWQSPFIKKKEAPVVRSCFRSHCDSPNSTAGWLLPSLRRSLTHSLLSLPLHF